jgi:hypothetical protein
MLEIDDNTLTALALREHAQTCDEVAQKYAPGADNRHVWIERAHRCRLLAVGFERIAEASKRPPKVVS